MSLSFGHSLVTILLLWDAQPAATVSERYSVRMQNSTWYLRLPAISPSIWMPCNCCNKFGEKKPLHLVVVCGALRTPRAHVSRLVALRADFFRSRRTKAPFSKFQNGDLRRSKQSSYQETCRVRRGRSSHTRCTCCNGAIVVTDIPGGNPQ